LESRLYQTTRVTQNFGILCVFGFGFLGNLLFSTQFNKPTAQDTTVTLYNEGSVLVPVHQVPDEENISPSHSHERWDLVNATHSDQSVIECERPNQADVFSWKMISYDIHTSGVNMRLLLDGICGYITPGTLTALMGESGAGKVRIGISGCGH
jgi:ATP-binding cassette, subfamily G (WHITE), member 2, SNQ2